MANPLVAQGSLNRLRASVIWPAFPDLNVTASYLGAEGIRLAFDGGTTVFLPSMTGAVTSPEPFQMVTMSMNLLKTQQLAALYKAQMEEDARIGDGQVYPDLPLGSVGIGLYQLYNCAIENVAELNFSGNDAGFRVTMRGYVLHNNVLWET